MMQLHESLTVYLSISTFLLITGLYGVMCRRNIIAILISIELMLNAANINFVAFDRFVAEQGGFGQVIALFIIALAAAEICLALSIVVILSRKGRSILIADVRELKG